MFFKNEKAQEGKPDYPYLYKLRNRQQLKIQQNLSINKGDILKRTQKNRQSFSSNLKPLDVKY